MGGVSSTSDNWAYDELVASIGKKETENPDDRELQSLAPHEMVIVQALTSALSSTGRSNTDVIFSFLRQRHGLRRADIVKDPGRFMSGLRDILGTGCQALERQMLQDIQDVLGVKAASIEQAVFLVEKEFGEGK